MERAALTYPEAARYLGISARTLRRMVDAGRIHPVYVAPGSPRFPIWALDELLRDGRDEEERVAR